VPSNEIISPLTHWASYFATFWLYKLNENLPFNCSETSSHNKIELLKKFLIDLGSANKFVTAFTTWGIRDIFSWMLVFSYYEVLKWTKTFFLWVAALTFFILIFYLLSIIRFIAWWGFFFFQLLRWNIVDRHWSDNSALPFEHILVHYVVVRNNSRWLKYKGIRLILQMIPGLSKIEWAMLHIWRKKRRSTTKQKTSCWRFRLFLLD